MKSVGCTLKLQQDANDPQSIRRCDLSIQGDQSQASRNWTLMDDSDDPRLAVGLDSGSWILNEWPIGSGSGAIFILDGNSNILVNLNSVPLNFLDLITCGSGLSGNGVHQGPPRSDIVYSLWFGCS